MNNSITASFSIIIKASQEQVWDALTNPEKIKKYFFGTQAISNWKEGSELLFKGNWEGNEYCDHGIIKKIIPNEIFQYTYLSSFSGLEDKPENYNLVTYKIEEQNKSTLLTVTQENMQSEEAKAHSEQGWKTVLEGMKKLIEEN